MTDKQITIDYENLCANYSKEVGCYNTFDGSCIKEQCFTYRLLQLLKAKEQECEELRQYHNKCCEENAKKLEEWLEKYNQLSKNFYNDKYCNKENCSLLKAKEQEYEKLKESLKVWKYSDVQHIFKINKYEQTLAEIKEIAKDNFYYLDCDYRWVLENILQKISECDMGDDKSNR